MRRSPSAVRREPASELRAAKKTAPTIEEVAKIPHDVINEQVIIAACIVDLPTRARLTKTLPAEGFYGKGHKAAWEALRELEKRGLAYDPATVRSIAPDVDTNYLDALVASRPELPDNLNYHVEAFHWDRRRVEVARGPLAGLVEALQDPTTDPDELRRMARSLGNAFDGTSSLRFLRDGAGVLAEMERELDESIERRRAGRPTFPYGIEGLDFYENGEPRLVPGAAPRMLTLVVGASGAGKTTIVNRIVPAQVRMGRRVLYGAWEVSDGTNLKFLAAAELGLTRRRVNTGDITDEERAAMKKRGREFVEGARPPVKFFALPFDQSVKREKRFGSLNELNLDVIHEHVEMAACDVAIFDLFHQALVETKPDDEKRALDRMQAIAKATKTHLILLHHLNKDDLKNRPDKRPTRDAIRGGVHWINAFDTILGLHIPGVWKNIPMTTMEVHVLKQRYDKWPLAVEFDYDADSGGISNGRSFDVAQTVEDAPEGSFGEWVAREVDGKKGRGRGR